MYDASYSSVSSAGQSGTSQRSVVSTGDHPQHSSSHVRTVSSLRAPPRCASAGVRPSSSAPVVHLTHGDMLRQMVVTPKSRAPVKVKKSAWTKKTPFHEGFDSFEDQLLYHQVARSLRPPSPHPCGRTSVVPFTVAATCGPITFTIAVYSSPVISTGSSVLVTVPSSSAVGQPYLGYLRPLMLWLLLVVLCSTRVVCQTLLFLCLLGTSLLCHVTCHPLSLPTM
ncbi:hypothetical protein PR048_011879 [Dryococelus australis]|uniref:Uncharacterized protein n=1 Tax=Dryococelus australis TaxID=614101 RepID=A0ABQ9HNL4_9NEOP|nr:hypothetical protein PR048_011879 [Dryococelus australis]